MYTNPHRPLTWTQSHANTELKHTFTHIHTHAHIKEYRPINTNIHALITHMHKHAQI